MNGEQQKVLYEQLDAVWGALHSEVDRIEFLNLLTMLRSRRDDPALWDLVKRWKYVETNTTHHSDNAPESDICHLPNVDVGT